MSPAQLAEILRQSAFGLKFAVERETRLIAEAAAKEARDMIGHENANWPALAPSTVAEKTRLGYVGRISATDPLYRTGTLRDSIAGEAEATASGAMGIVGSTDQVAEYQELGTSRIPPRPFILPTQPIVIAAAEVAFGELAVRALTPGKKP